MILNALILALSASIDSLGVGITYGLKKTKISISSFFILFILSIIITSLSVSIGNIITLFISTYVTKLIGAFVLFGIGIFIIYEATFKKEKKTKITLI